MALMAVCANAQTQLALGGQGGAGDWSWGWNSTGTSYTLRFGQWGEFILAKEGLTEGATYKLTVKEANAKVNLRINGEGENDVQYISIDKTEITGTIPANTKNIELQGTEDGAVISVLSFTIDGVQTAYATNWGTAFLGGLFASTGQWAELMMNGAEGKAGQDIIITANAAIPEGLQLKVKYDDDTEGYPAVAAGANSAKIYLEKPFKQVSLQAATATATTIDIASVTASFGVWSVLGSQALFGSNWDVESTDNELSTKDGVTYTLVKENLTLEAGTNYEYKVLKDHDGNWTVNYGADGILGGNNIILTVSETAIYKVTFTFNSQTHIISAESEKTGDITGPVTHTYSVCGTINGEWNVDTDMTKNANGLYEAVFTDVKAGTYEFKVKVDHDWSPAYPSQNYQLSVDTDGSTVTITFNEETHAVNATVTAPTGINSVRAAEQNAVIYNLAGQKVNAAYKGVVIVNGKKIAVK